MYRSLVITEPTSELVKVDTKATPQSPGRPSSGLSSGVKSLTPASMAPNWVTTSMTATAKEIAGIRLSACIMPSLAPAPPLPMKF